MSLNIIAGSVCGYAVYTLGKFDLDFHTSTYMIRHLIYLPAGRKYNGNGHKLSYTFPEASKKRWLVNHNHDCCGIYLITWTRLIYSSFKCLMAGRGCCLSQSFVQVPCSYLLSIILHECQFNPLSDIVRDSHGYLNTPQGKTFALLPAQNFYYLTRFAITQCGWISQTILQLCTRNLT